MRANVKRVWESVDKKMRDPASDSIEWHRKAIEPREKFLPVKLHDSTRQLAN